MSTILTNTSFNFNSSCEEKSPLSELNAQMGIKRRLETIEDHFKPCKELKEILGYDDDYYDNDNDIESTNETQESSENSSNSSPNQSSDLLEDLKFLKNDEGDVAELSLDDVINYVNHICENCKLTQLDSQKIAHKVYGKLKLVSSENELDKLIISCAAELSVDHYDYPRISVYLLIKKLHDQTDDDYGEVVKKMRANIDRDGHPAPMVIKSFEIFVKENLNEINKMFHYEQDYEINYFGYRTLERSYLKKYINGQIIERPQHMFMRVAIALHYRSACPLKVRMKRIKESYDAFSLGEISSATPTLFNAASPLEQLSSCFLLGIEDSMDAIGDCWKDCALISKNSGGLGLNLSNIRVDGAYIRTTQGTASGMKLLHVFNQIARYANQGGKRSGSIACYLEPWHADIFYFLDLKKPIGNEENRARDLFLALTINDIFMRRVEEDGVWSLMCPRECPNILNKYGKEFDKAYLEYETQGKFKRQIKARELWFRILESQIETGVPYILYKDAVNEKNNQKNLGVINGSNLCIEISLYHDSKEYAVCNLSSLCLPKFVRKLDNGETIFDYQRLMQAARIATRNLNNLIDINYYPVEKTRISNMKNRPIGVGCQGLADVFMMFETAFDSELARDLNRKIFETIYYGCLLESMEMAKEEGAYSTFKGSPLSEGKFQFDLWGIKKLSGLWDWNKLREDILTHGVRNSVTTASMPTASSSQIMGNNESIEPYTSNIYTRGTLAGDFYVVNRHLMNDLIKLNLWDDDMKILLQYYNGSIQQIDRIPKKLKEIYRTVWEIRQKSIAEMSADRGCFIDQTQSLNIHIANPEYDTLTSYHFYAWKLGLKTGIYYLRSKTASEANQFGIDSQKIKEIKAKGAKKKFVCDQLFVDPNTGEETCLSCSS